MKARTLAACVALFFIPSAAHADNRIAPHDNEVIAMVTPLSFAGFFGRHPTKEKIDTVSIAAVGLLIGYERHFSPYFRMGPRFEYLFPVAQSDDLHELRFVGALHGVLPLADGLVELSLGADAGLAVYTLADMKDHTVTAFSVGGILGVRVWPSDHVAVALDIGPTIMPDSNESQDGFSLSSFRILKASLGVALGF